MKLTPKAKYRLNSYENQNPRQLDKNLVVPKKQHYDHDNKKIYINEEMNFEMMTPTLIYLQKRILNPFLTMSLSL